MVETEADLAEKILYLQSRVWIVIATANANAPTAPTAPTILDCHLLRLTTHPHPHPKLLMKVRASEAGHQALLPEYPLGRSA